MKKKGLITAVLAAGLLGSCAYAWREAITMKIVGKAVTQRMQDPLPTLPDGLHVGLCGTGSPIADPSRGAPCTVVVAGRHLFLFDAGASASRHINRMDLPLGQLEAIFLTHFHSDHIDGLGEVLVNRWIQQDSDQPLRLIGPSGIEQVYEGLKMAYAHDTVYRTAHHEEKWMPAEKSGAQVSAFDVTGDEVKTVWDQDGVRIEAFRVVHEPVEPAVGYRIRYKGRTVVLSGDTAPSPQVEKMSLKADLLVHEALSPKLVMRMYTFAKTAGREKVAKLLSDIPTYHTTPEQVAELARKAEVKEVVLSHIVPPLPLPTMKEIFLEDANLIFKGPLRIGEDGDFISLPANSTDVIHARRWGR